MIRALVLLLVLAGCASAPPRVPLTESWPAASLDYGRARSRWTRRGGHSDDWMRIIEASATLESAEWRAAYARERARRLRLPPDEEARLVEAQKAASAESWEVELVVATAKSDWNDFRKGNLSMWRVSLASGDGREVLPLSITEDRRPRGELTAYFPDLQPFYQAYVVKFPKNTPDGKPLASGRLALKISSGVGFVELVWAE